ncbi:MAG: hypothetical protein AAFZ58_14580 [Pseudomonadota bacterium]
MPETAASSEAAAPLGFAEVRGLIALAWKPAVIGGILLAAAALGVSYLIDPTYRARTVLEYHGDPTQQVPGGGGLGDLGGFASLAGFNIGASGGQKETAVAYLKSKVFARRFIEKADIFRTLNAKKWDSDANEWRKEPTMWQTVESFHKDVLSVFEDPKTGLMVISIDWTDPEIAAQWAAGLITLLNDDLREQSVAETNRSLEYLRSELERASNAELQRVIAGLMESKIEALMFAGIRKEFAFRTIDPPVAPPEEEFVAPDRIVYFLMGGFVGGLLGAFLALFIAYLRTTRTA